MPTLALEMALMDDPKIKIKCYIRGVKYLAVLYF